MSNGRRGQRMTKEWTGIGGGVVLFTASATALLGALGSTFPNTVLRLIGEYIIMPTSAPDALDAVTVAVGIGVVSTDAATLGSTAMPEPSQEREFPWLYWAEHDLYFPTNTATNASSGASVRRSFDVKSMRKVKPGQSCVFVAQYLDVVGAPPIRFASSTTRLLIAT